MKICIGIISYLPDDNLKREVRRKRLLSLIDQCNKLFNLPILIIAQNWKDMSLMSYNGLYNTSNCTVYGYQKPLGIIGARNELRKKFLESEYDYLIMLDDDSTLKGSIDSANKYIKQIEDHPGMFGIFNGTLLKLFAISKEVFSLLDFGQGRVENGDYFEDILFVETLRKKYSNKEFSFIKYDLNERSNNYNDPESTWFSGQFNKHDIGDRTRAKLKEL